MEPTEITAQSLDLVALAKSPDAHKYTYGHALVLTGGAGKTGAARLAARGALRIGAGLVTLGCPHPALFEIAAQSTAIMCRPIDGAPGLAEMLVDTRINALCLGPGLGLGPDTQALVLAALKANRAVVLDADALSRFQRTPEVLFEALHPACLLTPHDGEFARLFPDLAESIGSKERAAAVKTAAMRAGCTILLKGAETLIVDESGTLRMVRSTGKEAAPWLATAGAGDVLAGFATGLLARGLSPLEAAGTAAWLHAACARRFGAGLIAEDLPETLPRVFADLGI